MLKPNDKIWWNEPNGTDGSIKQYEGRVTAVLADHKGVLACVWDAAKQSYARIVYVSRPHRLGIPLAEIVAEIQDKAVTKESAASAAFKQALAEIENPSLEDKLRLHGMGFVFNDLPAASKDAIPIDKMYF